MERGRQVVVPTSMNAVRDILRRLSEPIALFGEGPWETRDRLSKLLLDRDTTVTVFNDLKDHEQTKNKEDIIEYPFYTPGIMQLLEARRFIANFSVLRARQRIQQEKAVAVAVAVAVVGMKRDRSYIDDNYYVDDYHWDLVSSEIGDDRPLSGCSFSMDGRLVGTCSYTGVAKIWSVVNNNVQLQLVSVLKGHTGRATDIAFSPCSTTTIMATGSADHTAKLWNITSENKAHLLTTMEGHSDRLARIAFHPSGKYLATASYDHTWRLWDVHTGTSIGTELLCQEGHCRKVYVISFHPDGSLAASSGMDKVARIWDLRTGRNILDLQGHGGAVLGLDFSPNGYHVATASEEENICRVWDLRKKGQCLHHIAAHPKLISQVRFASAGCLITASHDRTARVWSSSSQYFKLVQTLSGHDSAITSVDITRDGQHIATAGLDRTINLWSKAGSKVYLGLSGNFAVSQDGEVHS